MWWGSSPDDIAPQNHKKLKKNEGKPGAYSSSPTFLFFVPLFGAAGTPPCATCSDQHKSRQNPLLHSWHCTVHLRSMRLTLLHHMHLNCLPFGKFIFVWFLPLTSLDIDDILSDWLDMITVHTWLGASSSYSLASFMILYASSSPKCGIDKRLFFVLEIVLRVFHTFVTIIPTFVVYNLKYGFIVSHFFSNAISNWRPWLCTSTTLLCLKKVAITWGQRTWRVHMFPYLSGNLALYGVPGSVVPAHLVVTKHITVFLCYL